MLPEASFTVDQLKPTALACASMSTFNVGLRFSSLALGISSAVATIDGGHRKVYPSSRTTPRGTAKGRSPIGGGASCKRSPERAERK